MTNVTTVLAVLRKTLLPAAIWGKPAAPWFGVRNA